MPQIDKVTFVHQTVLLFVSMVFIFVTMCGFFLPRVHKSLNLRQQRISKTGDFIKAAEAIVTSADYQTNLLLQKVNKLALKEMIQEPLHDYDMSLMIDSIVKNHIEKLVEAGELDPKIAEEIKNSSKKLK